jgi:hypothetical protein
MKIVGIALILLGLFNLYLVYLKKDPHKLTFFHQTFMFQWILGKKRYMTFYNLFISMIEITIGVVFLMSNIR